MKCFQIGGAIVFAAMVGMAEEVWKAEKPSVWSRDPGTIACKQTADGCFQICMKGDQDWAMNGFPSIPVEMGDEFCFTCETDQMNDSPGKNPASLSVVLLDGKGNVMDWSYGSQECFPGKPGETRMIIPDGVARIQPRVTGYGKTALVLRNAQIRRVKRWKTELMKKVEPCSIAQGDLRVTIDSAGGFSVSDQRTGRVWAPAATGKWHVTALEKEETGRSISLSMMDFRSCSVYQVNYRLVMGAPEVEVTIRATELKRPMKHSFACPIPFATRPGERMIVPMNEGISFPVDEKGLSIPGKLIAYGGHGICMAFFGVMADADGSGWMCLLETADDAAVRSKQGQDGRWTIGPEWDPQMKTFGYVRKARYCFFRDGGYVAMAKRYRDYARETGLLKTFTEKKKRNPNLNLLFGAANIWYMPEWGAKKRPLEVAKELQAVGVDKILWSAGTTPENIRALQALPGVIAGRYDIYQDIMDPQYFKEIGYEHSGWVTEAFPADINWTGPTAESWRRGWQVKTKKSGRMIPCATICDSKALPYARKRIRKDLETHPYKARFLDTTVASPWFECWNPAHPMTRSDSRRWKMELLRVVAEEFGMVCGSETGHDASVPYCDYFEGMLSLGPYRVPDSGRKMVKIWDEVPERVAKYQTGEKYRIPLWELVYHDCVVAQWYWGDYNNKLPALWHKRDLFNVLYGTPPMYLFNAAGFEKNREKIGKSFQIAGATARLTAESEMVDHRVLTKNRTVQQSRFSNGVVVTVNFGAEPFSMEGGKILPAGGYQIQKKGL